MMMLSEEKLIRHRASSKLYRTMHREKIKAEKKAYRAANLEKVKDGIRRCQAVKRLAQRRLRRRLHLLGERRQPVVREEDGLREGDGRDFTQERRGMFV